MRPELDRLQQTVEAVTGMPVSDEELPDTIGYVQRAERRLAEYRRGLMSEAGPGEGDDYVIVEGRSATRSYSPSSILLDVMAATDGDMVEAVRLLTERRAAELKFRWTELRRMFDQLGITLKVHPGEITDGDEAHVGEVWKTTTVVQHKDTYL